MERTLTFRRLLSREKLAARFNHPEALQPGGYYHNSSIPVMLLFVEKETKEWEHAMSMVYFPYPVNFVKIIFQTRLTGWTG